MKSHPIWTAPETGLHIPVPTFPLSTPRILTLLKYAEYFYCNFSNMLTANQYIHKINLEQSKEGTFIQNN